MRTLNLTVIFGAMLVASVAPGVARAAKPARSKRNVHSRSSVVANSAPAATKSQRKSRSHSKSRSKKHDTSWRRGQKGPTPDRINEIQQALARHGAYTGEPSGKWDAQTVEAMRRFQSSRNLKATGKLDALTLQKLGLGSDIAGIAPPQAMLPDGPLASRRSR